MSRTTATAVHAAAVVLALLGVFGGGTGRSCSPFGALRAALSALPTAHRI